MEPVETIEYDKGLVGKIFFDDDPPNPRKEWDNLGKMVCWHSRYNLGDEQRTDSPENFFRELALEEDPRLQDKIEYWENGKGYWKIGNFHLLHSEATTEYPSSKVTDSWDTKVCQAMEIRINKLIQTSIDKHFIVLPLFLYDHSGITMSTGSFSDRWDSGQVGWIFISVRKAKEEYGWKVLTKARRKQIETYLRNEVETYDAYLTGQVFGYVLEDAQGEELESCWGFFGEDHWKEELKDIAEYHLKKQAEERELVTLEEVGGDCREM